MADALDSSICALIGLGRASVLQPDLPAAVLLNAAIPDTSALATAHIVRGQWLARVVPVKVVGAGLAIRFFYYNMRRLGKGLPSDPDISVLGVLWAGVLEVVRGGVGGVLQRVLAGWAGKGSGGVKVE